MTRWKGATTSRMRTGRSKDGVARSAAVSGVAMSGLRRRDRTGADDRKPIAFEADDLGAGGIGEEDHLGQAKRVQDLGAESVLAQLVGADMIAGLELHRHVA